ncbi:MAG TPA: hypothetical protein PLP25_00135 [Candidatus Limiplasma sp.]|nr:hypothetical protein [Candidatus Limiplasma sp.]
MKDFYSKQNRKAAVAQIMADHAAYVEEQKRLHTLQAAYQSGYRAGQPAEDRERDDLYKAEPWRF